MFKFNRSEFLWSFLPVTLCLGLIFGCSKEKTSGKTAGGSSPRVVLIGLDGADWAIIDRLENAGRLPNLARWRREGSHGLLQSIPPLISPVVWTTLATGRNPLDHGIYGFLTRREGVIEPVRSDQRRVRAFWNIATDFQVPVGVIGWYATWPAETVQGYLISDRLGVHQVAGATGLSSGLAFPPSLQDELLTRRQEVESRIGAEVARRFFPPGADPGILPSGKYEAFLGQLRNTELYKSLFVELNSRFSPVLSAVYFEGTDAVGHLFVDYQQPAAEGVDQRLAEQFGGTFDAYYSYVDQVLGEMLSGIDPTKTTLIIVSDHGFRSGSLKPRIPTKTTTANQAPQWHRPEGIFLAWGRGIRPGVKLPPVQLVDVLPTVLRLSGLPVAGNLPGRSVEAAFNQMALAEPVRSVKDYEDHGWRAHVTPPRGIAASGDESERLTELRALGYVGDQIPQMASIPGGDGQETIPENVFNLGLLLNQAGRRKDSLEQFLRLQHNTPHSAEGFYGEGIVRMGAGDFGGAMRPLERAVELAPNLSSPMALLGGAKVRSGADREGAELLTRVLLLDPGNARVAGILGDVFLRHRNTAGAGALFQKAIEVGLGEDRARGLVGLAAVMEERRDFPGALERYRQALETFEDYPPALERAGNLCLVMGQDQDALHFLQRLVQRQPDNAQGQVLLGMAEARLGRPAEARAAWGKALHLDPKRVEIRRLLDQLPQR